MYNLLSYNSRSLSTTPEHFYAHCFPVWLFQIFFFFLVSWCPSVHNHVRCDIIHWTWPAHPLALAEQLITVHVEYCGDPTDAAANKYNIFKTQNALLHARLLHYSFKFSICFIFIPFQDYCTFEFSISQF